MKTPDSFVPLCVIVLSVQGFPGSSVVKNLPTNAGDTGLTPAQPQINIKKKKWMFLNARGGGRTG